MIQKLRNKGYTYSKNWGKDVLTGEFNGTDVNIYIGTNNNKAWRIYIADDNTRDEYQIKLRFNTLCEQFERKMPRLSRNMMRIILYGWVPPQKKDRLRWL